MDHQFVIEAGKGALLEANTLRKTSYFFVEYDGGTATLVMPPCSCGRQKHHCFDVARQVAVQLQWEPAKVEELAYIGVERQSGMSCCMRSVLVRSAHRSLILT